MYLKKSVSKCILIIYILSQLFSFTKFDYHNQKNLIAHTLLNLDLYALILYLIKSLLKLNPSLYIIAKCDINIPP